MTNKDTILDAIAAHGAKKVYNAASARMSGDRAKLQALGLSAQTIGDANTIMVIAFAQMGQADKAADLADIAIKQAKIYPPSPFGSALGDTK